MPNRFLHRGPLETKTLEQWLKDAGRADLAQFVAETFGPVLRPGFTFIVDVLDGDHPTCAWLASVELDARGALACYAFPANSWDRARLDVPARKNLPKTLRHSLLRQWAHMARVLALRAQRGELEEAFSEN